MDFFDISFTIIFWVGVYFAYKIIQGALFVMKGEPNPNYVYKDDEPDGSNYVTLPDGDRRLD